MIHKCNMCGVDMGNIPMMGGICGRCYAEKQQRENQERRHREDDERRKQEDEHRKFNDLTRRASDQHAQAQQNVQAGLDAMRGAGSVLKGILIQSTREAGADVVAKRVPAPSGGSSCGLRLVAVIVGFFAASLAVGIFVPRTTPGDASNLLLFYAVLLGTWIGVGKLVVVLGKKRPGPGERDLSAAPSGPGRPQGQVALHEVGAGWRCAHCGSGGQGRFRGTKGGRQFEYCSRQCAEQGQQTPIPGWTCAHCGQGGYMRFRGQVDGKTLEYCSRACGESGVVTCGKCRRTSRSNSAFCPGCGTSLRPSACTGCGTTSAPGTKFCASCGASLLGG